MLSCLSNYGNFGSYGNFGNRRFSFDRGSACCVSPWWMFVLPSAESPAIPLRLILKPHAPLLRVIVENLGAGLQQLLVPGLALQWDIRRGEQPALQRRKIKLLMI